MSHIFISYSRFDRDYADQLADSLLSQGYNVWIDTDQLRASEDWWKSIVLALKTCEAFIVIMTPHSDRSRWVQRELTLALKYDKPVFPLLLEGDPETDNWLLLVRTQIHTVIDGQMPGSSFYDSLLSSGVRRRRDMRGSNVTNVFFFDNVALSEDDTIRLDEDIKNPPKATPEDPEGSMMRRPESIALAPTRPRSKPPRSAPLLLNGAVAVAVVLMVLVIGLIAATVLQDGPITAGTSTATPAPVDLEQPASLEALNAWRAAEGYPPLVENAVLMAVAADHLNDLRPRTREEIDQGSPFFNSEGRQLDTLPAAAGYAAPVVTFAYDSEAALTLGTLLEALDRRAGAAVHETAREVGLAMYEFSGFDRFIFITILGEGTP